MNIKQVVKKILPPIVSDMISTIRNATAYRRYRSKGGIPFSRGYLLYSVELIVGSLKNERMLDRFRQGELLPHGYGVGISERCVEYPWLIAQLEEESGILLDAGSALNHAFLLDLPRLRSKKIHILTLAPEERCFWQNSVSYLFHDLREIPIRDEFYDTIACISTLEHIGCDNSSFTGKDSDREHRPEDFMVAIQELCRVLKPGGSLFITLPFGVYAHQGVQQQFDEKMLSRIVETLSEVGRATECFYLYSANGWNVATKADCVGCHYVEWSVNLWEDGGLPNPIPEEPDRAVAARAVACVRMIKRVGVGLAARL